ncbi:hypothetical protein H9X96_17140 [Pedobacter sp. N36a]|uniref:hypothetical protein n=1 Tax=Pedobacter sp. N36a TaxID=2767996 RepID=UPI001656EEAB|nr:hypothetical protein [Pedobacter sp. N36a]MBC8987496.1 hypothetical protein [Pedobacter sp. N36a]
MKKSIFIILLLCFNALISNAQHREKIIKEYFGLDPIEFKNQKDSVNELIRRHFSITDVDYEGKLKDSVALYSFAIELNVVKHKDSTLVKTINVNDSIAKVLYKDFYFLKYINFSSVLKEKKEAILVIPVAIQITWINKPTMATPMLKAGDGEILDRIATMFNLDLKQKKLKTDHFIYLTPILYLAGTKTYE